MVSEGTVRSWDFDNKFGVIESVDTPGGCRAMSWDVMVEGVSVTGEDGFSTIGLPVGESVGFEWKPAAGDEEFDFCAVAVWPSRCDPPAEIPRGAFRTSLWTMTDGDVRGDGAQIAREMNAADLPEPPPRAPLPRTVGTVRSWKPDEGWGVVDSAETPGGAWVHFSEIRGVSGFRTLETGAHVEFAWEEARQDGFAYRGSDIDVIETPAT
ncbi:cold-shock protein [Williamsia sp. M5A3_1d]